MFGKKESAKPGLSPVEVDAKSGVLKELKRMAEGMMGDKIGGLKKVTVASNDPKGLTEGLAKAKELIGADGELPTGEDEVSEDVELAEAPEASDFDSMTEEEIDAKLAELMAAKEKKKGVI